MISLCFGWAISGLVIGYLDGSHDVRLVGWILFALASALAVAARLITDYHRNASASIDLMRSERQRDGRGAV